MSHFKEKVFFASEHDAKEFLGNFPGKNKAVIVKGNEVFVYANGTALTHGLFDIWFRNFCLEPKGT
jgi:hypothetical protein